MLSIQQVAFEQMAQIAERGRQISKELGRDLTLEEYRSIYECSYCGLDCNCDE